MPGLRIVGTRRVEASRRGHDARARELELDEDARGAVLERLEGADAHAELLALLEVGHGELEGLGHAAEHLGAQARGRHLDRRLDHGSGTALLAHQRAGAHLDAAELDECCSPRVDAPLPLERETGRAGFDQEQRDAVAVVGPTGGSRRNEDAVGARRIEDLLLRPVDAEARAGAFGPRLDVVDRVAGTRLLVRQREPPFASRRPGEPGLLLRFAPGRRERAARQQYRRQERLGRQVATERLQHHHELRETHPRSAVLFGNGDANPAELGHLLPQDGREAEVVAGIAQRAKPGHGRLLCNEVGRGLGEQFLVFV